ncbi:MAG: dihydroneopterin aldolase [Rhodospirillales bacterium]|jgi:dihydroneopterin aldolase|nr:dihydroneopterin aldolase [Rhodospirillales bacterium]MDP6804797.1 dihydroneopterin aldolase [Rhodospirillales bacterium]
MKDGGGAIAKGGTGPARGDETARPAGTRRMFVRDLVLPCSIGVHRHERDAPQTIRINLDLAVEDDDVLDDDDLANVVSYEDVVEGVRAVVGHGHVNLIETLAERIAERCLEDPRVPWARVRVEKLDVLPNVRSAGIEIERWARKV